MTKQEPVKLRKSVFEKYSGRIELYFENTLIKSVQYNSVRRRKEIIDQWNREVKNLQDKRNIYYKIIPK